MSPQHPLMLNQASLPFPLGFAQRHQEILFPRLLLIRRALALRLFPLLLPLSLGFMLRSILLELFLELGFLFFGEFASGEVF